MMCVSSLALCSVAYKEEVVLLNITDFPLAEEMVNLTANGGGVTDVTKHVNNKLYIKDGPNTVTSPSGL